MPIPAVATPILAGAASAGFNFLLNQFDDTSQEICLCLNEINNTLLDGFSGLDVRAEAEERAAILQTNLDIADLQDSIRRNRETAESSGTLTASHAYTRRLAKICRAKTSLQEEKG